MPTYEYKCRKCEEVFEVSQKINDPPLKGCPVCGGELTKLISGGVGIIFRGNGFYTTDHKKDSTSVSKTLKSDDKDDKKESKQDEVVKP